MKKLIFYILLIVLIPAISNLYAYVRLAPYHSVLVEQDVSASYRLLARKVEAGEISLQEVANRIDRMADGENKVVNGLKQLGVAAYFWLLSVVFIAVLQGMLIYKLLKTHNPYMIVSVKKQ